MKLKYVVLIFAGAVAGIWWAAERNAVAGLRLQVAALRRETPELIRLREEHNRLLSLQPTAEELADLRRAGISVRESPAAGKIAAILPAGGDHGLRAGTWTTPAEWENCGRTTPELALETIFWAATNGDLAALKETFEFDAAARTKADAILAGLPEAARQSYGGPEDLLTLLTAREIPLGEVQRFARTEHNLDTITDSLVLRNAEGQTQQVHLTFHRDENGWRLLVPANAVDRMVKELTGAPPEISEPKGSEILPPSGTEPKKAG